MRYTILIAACTLLIGCGCKTLNDFPLQPGEKVIFLDDVRANNYRAASGNDLYNRGSIVKITQPTSLETKR